MLYERLDALRERASTRLARTLLEHGSTHQARSEREAVSALYTERLAQLNAAESGLCFGRLDLDQGERRYIGRLGILDESADYEPLLVDWRAPAARPFYLATAATPDGVRRRRHIKTRRRVVVGIDDEVLDLAMAGQTRDAVLIVGPNATFLRYISQVLPSLGETGVLLSTLGDLYPGVSARRAEPAEEAQVTGRLVMADVVAAAVRDRQWVPDDGLEIAVGRDRLWLDRRVCERAAELARHSRLPHNPARPIVVREIIDALARQLADRIGADVRGGKNLLDETDLEEIRRDLRGEPAVRQALDRLWPTLTPERLLADLYASEERLARAAAQLPPAERGLLRRDPGGGWTPADVPLLDEAAELLGEDD